MNVARININSTDTLVSLGINEEEILINTKMEDSTIELEEIIDEINNLNNE